MGLKLGDTSDLGLEGALGDPLQSEPALAPNALHELILPPRDLEWSAVGDAADAAGLRGEDVTGLFHRSRAAAVQFVDTLLIEAAASLDLNASM